VATSDSISQNGGKPATEPIDGDRGALTPPELVQAHLNLDDATMAALSKCKRIIAR
jgi:hypothetical protein